MDNLFSLLLLPLISAIVLVFVRSDRAKWVALLLSLINLGLTVPFLLRFDPQAGVQFEQMWVWIERLNVNFHIGLDGISLPLVLLTNGLIPLIIATTDHTRFKGNFYALVLFMQLGLLLVFTALDAFSFYVGWEIALIPIYFICALWGTGDRVATNLKFFIYTFAGSILMLIGILYLYQQTPAGSFEWTAFAGLNLPETTQHWVFWAFFLAFAIKIPILPFHTWQPNTYVQAPAAGTMLLSGIMLKMGVFGLIRWLLPIAPLGVAEYGTLVMTLCVIGIVYASLIAFRQDDAKRLIAYSSIAHVGLISGGVFSLTVDGLQGAMIQMVNHGISVVGLFFVIDLIERRTGSRSLSELGGLASRTPKLAIAFLILVMGAVGLPLTNGFIGEFLLLKGLFGTAGYGLWYAVFGGLTLILGAVYMLRLYQKTMLGELPEQWFSVSDIKSTDVVILGILVVLVVVIGVLPNYLLELSEPAINNLLQQISFRTA
ncbi:complex I subunit 4 family protein [Sphingobacterium corticibacter]|uniref:NADH-quinone oxidoreductase subunit M n=1 Tax=Sphingobacterium corticibacter TaxID=2171749 RepID=A0A2T8HKD2_9SPHI|nr:NADH-quinone oxidoreductase subunit M [Sphingobacterium corticibacter]PVH25908.1 NADH-quinone oxidoreductase subunit M [Sphingobacterium corticibacter]